MLNIYKIEFEGVWLPGKAIVEAVDEESAWRYLKIKWDVLEPLSECKIEKLPKEGGILYFDDGNY